MSHKRTDDIRIQQIQELAPPSHIVREFPLSEQAAGITYESRRSIHRLLHRADDRLLLVIGPCSIHDINAAKEYAFKLKALRSQYQNCLEIVMRVYFEKPRTTVGWKGLINDPDLDDSYQINKGLRLARELLVAINEMGLPCGTEYLDVISPQYLGDLVAWGAIGARTTESQVHRELASGLSCPVGFKNGTDGNIKIAVDAIKAAERPHHFMSVTKGGHSAIVSTTGNEDCHIILRGGATPNYDKENVQKSCDLLAKAGLSQRVMVDASHANSQKKHQNQIAVCQDIAQQLMNGEERIFGMMVESHLIEGKQDLVPGQPLTYGQSITDACLGWSDTETVVEILANAVRERRKKLTQV